MLKDYKIELLLGRVSYQLESFEPAPEEPDLIEVGRAAHELSERQGPNAYKYAARSAAEALEDGKFNEAVFWKAVAYHLMPRGDQLTDTARD